MTRVRSVLSASLFALVATTSAHADLAHFVGGSSQITFGGIWPQWGGYTANVPSYGSMAAFDPTVTASHFATDTELGGPGISRYYMGSASWFTTPTSFGVAFSPGTGMHQIDASAPFYPTMFSIRVLADFVLDYTIPGGNGLFHAFNVNGTFDPPAGVGNFRVNSTTSIMTAPNVFTPAGGLNDSLAWAATGSQGFNYGQIAIPGSVVPAGTTIRVESTIRFEVKSAGALSELRLGGIGRFTVTPSPGSGALIALGGLCAMRRRR